MTLVLSTGIACKVQDWISSIRGLVSPIYVYVTPRERVRHVSERALLTCYLNPLRQSEVYFKHIVLHGFSTFGV